MATTMPSFVRASLSSPPLSNDTLDYSFRPDLKPFSVQEAVHPKPDVVKRCETKIINLMIGYIFYYNTHTHQRRKIRP